MGKQRGDLSETQHHVPSVHFLPVCGTSMSPSEKARNCDFSVIVEGRTARNKRGEGRKKGEETLDKMLPFSECLGPARHPWR